MEGLLVVVGVRHDEERLQNNKPKMTHVWTVDWRSRASQTVEKAPNPSLWITLYLW